MLKTFFLGAKKNFEFAKHKEWATRCYIDDAAKKDTQKAASDNSKALIERAVSAGLPSFICSLGKDSHLCFNKCKTRTGVHTTCKNTYSFGVDDESSKDYHFCCKNSTCAEKAALFCLKRGYKVQIGESGLATVVDLVSPTTSASSVPRPASPARSAHSLPLKVAPAAPSFDPTSFSDAALSRALSLPSCTPPYRAIIQKEIDTRAQAKFLNELNSLPLDDDADAPIDSFLADINNLDSNNNNNNASAPDAFDVDSVDSAPAAPRARKTASRKAAPASKRRARAPAAVAADDDDEE